jgi:hypothetical protein
VSKKTELGSLQKAFEAGLHDGAEAFRSSGSTADPSNGWDADLINAVGLAKTQEILGYQEGDDFDDYLIAYNLGCRAGCMTQANSHGD